MFCSVCHKVKKILNGQMKICQVGHLNCEDCEDRSGKCRECQAEISILDLPKSQSELENQSQNSSGGSGSLLMQSLNDKKTNSPSIYDFVVKDLHGTDVNLSKYDNNQVLLIVNFATNIELADRNFLELKDIKQKFCDDITILLFPCCQFGDPMPERDGSEIFCLAKFEGLKFAEVFSMVNVKGPQAHPMFKYLTQAKALEVDWNFTKFLVDKRGQVVERFSHTTEFIDIENAVKRLI